MAGVEQQYEFNEVKVLRGTEARAIAKWQKQGWEFVTQSQGALRTEMTFRRVKPKVPWRPLAALLGGGVLLMVIVGVAAAIWGGDGTSESTAPPTKAAVAPSGPPTSAPVVPTDHPSENQPTATTSTQEAAPYKYQGPKYEIVVVDENQSSAKLNHYWLYTKRLDYSTDAYKVQIKRIVSDVAQREKTGKFFAEVVTDKEIALAEAVSTYENFIVEHGEHYAVVTIPQKEKTGWIASYAGGYDFDAGEPSESSFEVTWMPNAKAKVEKWRPDIAR